ncbi:MAG TPA: UDP-glucose 4-epimerase GalE [Candidatus Saccharimonadales bacterium]|jgi:UDP-glucose 4-epimerase
MHVLVTGGAGYIGSHTIIELLANGHRVTVVDSLVNSSKASLDRVEDITGQAIPFTALDLCDKPALEAVFATNTFDAVIHFAGLKAVGESVQKPLWYYRNNIDSTLVLCEVMSAHHVKKLIFSSSATVYGVPESLPLTESSRTGVGITNPYGQTKYMIEQILHDLAVSDPQWQISILRYFNPIGAHASGQIGEDPNGIPNNLLPYVSQVAVGKLAEIQIFGNDYETSDGTGVRDYIHVVDLAKGHVAALEHLPVPGDANAYNLGTGTGASVLELIHAFEKACGKQLPYKITGRRPGDIANCYADVSLAANDLAWKAEKSIEDACRDAWHWQSQHPNGYKS